MHTEVHSGVALLATGLALACASGTGTLGATTARAVHATAARAVHATAARAVHAAAEARIPNVRVSHDAYSAHAEPSLAVNPRDPRDLLGAAMFIRGKHVVAGTFASFDGGRTWDDHGPLAMPPGTTYSGDVTVAFDAHGASFVACLVQATSGDGVYVWRSGDGGRTFRRPVAVEHGSFADHPGLAIDTAPGPESGALYVTWRTRAGLSFSRSTDGGRHFSAPRLIVTGETWIPVIAAGPRGAVYVAYEATTQGADGHVAVVASADHGRHFGRPAVLGPMDDTLAPAPGILLPTGPSIATSPRDGAIYVAYAAYQAGATYSNLLVTRSQAEGHVWSAPVRVTSAARSTGTVYFQPRVAMDDAGGVDVTSLALAHGRVGVILFCSRTNGAGFGPGRRITDQPFALALGVYSAGKGDQSSYRWIGDYQGLAAGGGLVHPLWNDTRSGRLEIYTAAVSDK